MRYIISALLFLLIASASGYADVELAEKLEELKPKKKIKGGDKAFEMGSYINAVKYYHSAFKDKKGSLSLMHKLAESYRLMRDYQTSLKWYKKLDEEKGEDSDNYILTKYYLALMQKMTGNYNKAKENFTSFIDNYEGDNKDRYKKIVAMQKSGCEFGNKTTSNPEKVEFELPEGNINNALSEYAPHLLKEDKMMFSSLQSDTAINLTKQEKNYTSKIYTSEKEDGKWKYVKKLPEPINDDDMHVGNGVYGPDGKVLYFTKCKQKKKQAKNYNCDIYKSEKEDGEWQSPDKLGNSINSADFNSQPYPVKTKEGKEILYFVQQDYNDKASNKDIYYAVKKDNGSYEDAQSVGDSINTILDEVTPFYDKENEKLYFSSEGHNSIGGLDVFAAKGSENSWQEVENLGYPTNTPNDELYYILQDSKEKGFLVSNKPGGPAPDSFNFSTCCDDIFAFDIINEVTLKAYAYEKGDMDKKPMGNVNVSIYTLQDDNMTFMDNLTTQKNAKFQFTVDPRVDYKVRLQKDRFLTVEDTLALTNRENVPDTIEKAYPMERIRVDKLILSRVYYDFDKSNIQGQYSSRLDTVINVLNENEGFSVELVGHTDHMGTDKYNMKLGENRANAAKDYLMDNGVKEERIIVTSKGESTPIAPNDKENGADNPDGRAKNRRVEYKFYSADDEPIKVEYKDNYPDMD